MLEMLRSRDRVVWPTVTTVVALVLFFSTLQTDISDSHHPYAADVGEIQNAFPRWALVHYSGYPLYTAAGSLFANALWLIGLEPAAAASLLSAVSERLVVDISNASSQAGWILPESVV